MAQVSLHGRRLLGVGGTLMLLALAVQAWGQEAEVVEKNLNASGTSTPIKITADKISTWDEKDDRVLLVQGNIRIDQGATSITMGQGAVWVDLKRKNTQGAYFLNVYGENGVQLVANGDKQQGKRGMFALTTSGDVQIKSLAGNLVQQNLTTDPAYTRAYEERKRIQAAAAVTAASSSQPATILQAQATEPVPPVPQPPQPPTDFPTPAPFQPPQPAGAPPPPVFPPNAGAPATPTFPAPPAPGTLPPVPPPPPFFGPAVTPPTSLPTPPVSPRQFSIRPRTSEEIRVRNYTSTATGETVYVVSSGVIINIADPKNKVGILDIEADRMVFWTRGDGKQLFESMKNRDGETTQQIEFYVAGNVEMRTKTKKEEEILRCDELYYDASRSVAIGTKADLEIRQAKLPFPIHLRAPEILQLNDKTYQADNAEIFSTVLPSDPGLKMVLKTVTVVEKEVPRKTIFGTPVYDTVSGEPKVDKKRYFEGRNFLVYAENIPVFYFPFLRGDVEDPLGPLDNIGFGGSNIFGFTFTSTWDVYQLIGLDRPKDTRWQLYLDYFSYRGPAMGTQLTTQGKNLFGIENKYTAFVKAFGIYDTGVQGTNTDILGGDRGKFYFPPPPGTQIPFTHPDWRGRVQSRFNVQDLPEGFTVQGQLALISDQNFIEQYFLNEWLTDYNQETTLYVKQQQDQWAWSILAQPHLRDWITEAAWLPRADGWLLGHKFLDDRLTLNVHGSAGYVNFSTPNVPSYAYLPTDVPGNLGRFDLWSELSMPLTAGAFRLAPYLVGDAAYYTSDINGDGQGRLLGGVGLRANLPFSRLFPDVQSDFWNVDSIYHKVNLSTNYLYARSSVSYNQLPQLDRLNDDTTDQAMRDLQYRQIFINPSNAAFLTNVNGLVNPQTYAIRRLIDSRIDTLDSINVAQFNLENRWQTRRGIGASEHVIDWMSLSLGASLFPQASRDNYGETWGILEYDWNWNVGDRTALYSNGWMEPVSGGPRVFNIGTNINRPDGTAFGLGYRQIDPLNSKAVVGSIGYRFSQKYAISASTVWDFGVGQQTYGLGITRTGTDIQMSFGVSYNSVLQTLGVQFEIVPNLMKSRMGSTTGMANNYLTGGR